MPKTNEKTLKKLKSAIAEAAAEAAAEVLNQHFLGSLQASEQVGNAPNGGVEQALVINPELQPLVSALQDGVLAPNQEILLRNHYYNKLGGGAPLSVAQLGHSLISEGMATTHEEAEKLVSGAYRALGRRLNKFLPNPPMRVGRDRSGDGVADPVPLMAMFEICRDLNGKARHLLTANGATAVGLALGLESDLDSSMDDTYPTPPVALAMDSLTAALVLRVARTWECSVDDALRRMTSAAGAG